MDSMTSAHRKQSFSLNLLLTVISLVIATISSAFSSVSDTVWSPWEICSGQFFQERLHKHDYLILVSFVHRIPGIHFNKRWQHTAFQPMIKFKCVSAHSLYFPFHYKKKFHQCFSKEACDIAGPSIMTA